MSWFSFATSSLRLGVRETVRDKKGEIRFLDLREWNGLLWGKLTDRYAAILSSTRLIGEMAREREDRGKEKGGRERGWERGREGEKEGGREGGRERGREGEKERGRERGREGEREGGREGGRKERKRGEGGREGEKEGGRKVSEYKYTRYLHWNNNPLPTCH